MSSSLHKIVDREKRILYEKRVAGPTVSIVCTGNKTIPADEEVTIAVDIRLSEALAENVTINLVRGRLSDCGVAPHTAAKERVAQVGSISNHA